MQTLPNLNPLGLGHDITFNTVDLVQYRVDGGSWVDGNRYGGYDVNISQTITAPSTSVVELRTICEETGVTSPIVLLGGPEVTVLGNGISIVEGDATPAAADGTDFGLVAQSGAPVSHAFTVRNDGTITLTLGAVTVPTGFTLTEGLATSLAPGASDTFTVQLDTTTIGTKTGAVSFTSSDTDENPFHFAITGTVTAAGVPAVTVTATPSAVAEDGTANLVCTFTRSVVSSSALTVNFSVGGTGTYGTDYTQTGAASFAETAGTVIIPAGQTTAQVTIDPTADTAVEPDETVLLNVVAGTGYTVGAPGGATGTILNDEESANLALGKTAVASTTAYPTLPPSNVTDGNRFTPWSSEFTDNEWIYVDLGAVCTIDRIVLQWETAYGRSYRLQVSNDAATWSNVYSTTTGDGGVEDITLSTPASGRYVRVLGIQRATRYGYCLYEFEVYGSEVGASEVTVLGNGAAITDGDTTPSTADHTDFGSAAEGGAPILHTFTVRNDGTTPLTLGAVTVPTGFTLTEGLATSLAPGAFDTFTVQLDTAIIGTKTGEISFATSDSDENPFNFAITGTVTAAGVPEVTVTVTPGAVTEDGTTNLLYTFTRSVAYASALTVNFSVGGTAAYGTDYTQTGAASFAAASGTVIIPAGQTTAQVTIDPTPDTTVEPDETVLLTVTAGTGYAIGTPAGATGTVLNDDGVATGNLALGKTAVASTSYSGFPASNVTDGDVFSRWSSLYSDNEWIYVDLGAVYTINRVVLRWENAYGHSYQLQVSNDAATWSNVYSTTTGDGGVDDITLSAPASGRYVRLLGIQRGLPPYGYSLFEFEVYGGGGGGPAEVTVLGNGASITDGDTTPSAADYTDFGSAAQGGAPVSHTFTVRNDGAATLTLGAVTVPTGFTLTEGLATSLASGAFDTFTVQLDTAIIGTKTGEISFVTNDSDENPSNFAIAGTVTAAGVPAVTVTVTPGSVTEDGATNLLYTFTRSVATGSALTVNFSVGGTAIYGVCYTQTGAASFTAASGTVIIPAGQATAQVTVDPTPDTTVEPDETVLLTVTAGTGYTIGTPAGATATILSDDGEANNLALGKTAVASTSLQWSAGLECDRRQSL